MMPAAITAHLADPWTKPTETTDQRMEEAKALVTQHTSTRGTLSPLKISIMGEWKTAALTSHFHDLERAITHKHSHRQVQRRFAHLGHSLLGHHRRFQYDLQGISLSPLLLVRPRDRQ